MKSMEGFERNVSCHNLMFLLFREAIMHMKEGEEEKTKTYNALIWTEKEIWSKDIAFLDNMQVVYLEWHVSLLHWV